MSSTMDKGCNVSYPALSGSTGVGLECTINKFQGHGMLREKRQEKKKERKKDRGSRERRKKKKVSNTKFGSPVPEWTSSVTSF